MLSYPRCFIRGTGKVSCADLNVGKSNIPQQAVGQGKNLRLQKSEIRSSSIAYWTSAFPHKQISRSWPFLPIILCDDEFQQLPSAQMEEYLRADGHTLSRQTISNYLLCLEAASLICRGFDYLYYFAFGGYHKDTDEITYKRAWSEHWERIQQGWPSSESIVQMRMDYGGVARKHPLLIFSAFFNPMYGQIIDWALEAMNVDLGKSD